MLVMESGLDTITPVLPLRNVYLYTCQEYAERHFISSLCDCLQMSFTLLVEQYTLTV